MNMENVKAQVEVITPEIAKEYLKFNQVNRPLNKRTVEYYADQMKRGQWMLNGESISFSKGGTLVNGQHRLNAIIKADVSVQILVVRGVDEESFITFDNGRIRTMGDIFSLADIPSANRAAAIVKRYIMMKKELNAITNTTSTISARAHKISKKDMFECYNNDKELFDKATKLSYSLILKLKIMNGSEVGACYAYLIREKKHPEEFVEAFFKMLFYNENVSNNTINLLREKYIQSSISKSMKMSSAYKEAIFIKTWNAYVTRKELSLLRWNESLEGKLNYL